MNSDRLVGSVGVRLATVVFFLLSVTALALYERGLFPNGRALLVLAVGSAILGFMGMIHAFRTLYARWMRWAMILHIGMITILFGACYLLVVPVFFLMVWPFDLLRLRKRIEPETFWIRRRSSTCDLTSFQRMG
jgi:hypothetical protein